MVSKSIVYFPVPGDHTEETLKASKERADELGIKDIVVASTEGSTALEAVKVLRIQHSSCYSCNRLQRARWTRAQRR